MTDSKDFDFKIGHLLAFMTEIELFWLKMTKIDV